MFLYIVTFEIFDRLFLKKSMRLEVSTEEFYFYWPYVALYHMKATENNLNNNSRWPSTDLIYESPRECKIKYVSKYKKFTINGIDLHIRFILGLLE